MSAVKIKFFLDICKSMNKFYLLYFLVFVEIISEKVRDCFAQWR